LRQPVKLHDSLCIDAQVFRHFKFAKSHAIKGLPPVFSLGSLIFEFQTFYILLSVDGSISPFDTPELIENLRIFNIPARTLEGM